jgi:hypothetical protein
MSILRQLLAIEPLVALFVMTGSGYVVGKFKLMTAPTARSSK